ncbi:UPF0184 protein AAEL002161 [Anopheles bellator]|uniref:UPF0184 protein AAEL002161 n=1 Tax=Anopheles bellator TaxID=139047 RepID=UPI002649A8ED|nr:UPF0184 protein AAEL002161 [Anopheles bellator]
MPPDPKENASDQNTRNKATVSDEGSGTEQAVDENSMSEDNDLDLDEETEEFHSVNASLDMVSSVLDAIEQRNDSLREQLLQLLESQRETLKSFKEENQRIAEQNGADEPDTEPMDE